ncbi:MAG TPA: hypothetical protein VGA27_14270, partial [Candidatus Binatia bacterium]
MRVIDADGHVEENPITFSDKYFAPAFRVHRPQVVPGTEEGLAYWMIDEQLFPRRVGRGCNNLGTPASINGKPVRHAQRKPDSLGSMELTALNERLQIMDEENIWLQVLYPTLFLAYPLSSNPAYVSAMCEAYN